MKKKNFLFTVMSVFLLIFAALLFGCFSMPSYSAPSYSLPDNVEEITDFTSVPEPTDEATPLEGTWRGVIKTSYVTTTVECTFSGNQYTSVIDTGYGDTSGEKGVFNIVDNNLVLYSLQTWNTINYTWTALPYTMLSPAYGGTVIKALKTTNTLVFGNGQFTLSYGKNSNIYSKINTPTLVLKEPKDIAQSYGLVLNENESIVELSRITETGMQARIGEPEEWQVFINGDLSKTIGKNKTIAFILPNGTHKIYVYMGRGADQIAKSDEITVNAQSSRIRLETDITGGAANQRVNLRQSQF